MRNLRLPGSDTVTIGVQGVIVRGRSVLLVRHGYRPGWHFPGGGLERGETATTGLAREVLEETGVIATAPPRLFGIYTHFDAFPGDHIVLYVLHDWDQPQVPPPNYEIQEQRFFEADRLPQSIVPGAARRIGEIFDGRPRSAAW